MSFTVLENSWIRLELLNQKHTPILWKVVQHIDVFAFSPNDLSSEEKLEKYTKAAIEEYKQGKSIPYAIFDKQENKYIGSSRFGYIDSKNGTLHIGWTWISKESQGTGLNGSLKQLMLSHAFGPMKMRKVIFRVDALNIRSRKAVEKLGAHLEGVLKEDVYVKDQRLRDTCCYALFKEDFIQSN